MEGVPKNHMQKSSFYASQIVLPKTQPWDTWHFQVLVSGNLAAWEGKSASVDVFHSDQKCKDDLACGS